MSAVPISPLAPVTPVNATLTLRQAQILAFIQDTIASRGMPPTRAEIARQFDFKSPNAAEEHLRALQRKGVIELIPAIPRGIRVRVAA